VESYFSRTSSVVNPSAEAAAAWSTAQEICDEIASAEARNLAEEMLGDLLEAKNVAEVAATWSIAHDIYDEILIEETRNLAEEMLANLVEAEKTAQGILEQDILEQVLTESCTQVAEEVLATMATSGQISPLPVCGVWYKSKEKWAGQSHHPSRSHSNVRHTLQRLRLPVPPSLTSAAQPPSNTFAAWSPVLNVLKVLEDLEDQDKKAFLGQHEDAPTSSKGLQTHRHVRAAHVFTDGWHTERQIRDTSFSRARSSKADMESYPATTSLTTTAWHTERQMRDTLQRASSKTCLARTPLPLNRTTSNDSQYHSLDEEQVHPRTQPCQNTD